MTLRSTNSPSPGNGAPDLPSLTAGQARAAFQARTLLQSSNVVFVAAGQGAGKSLVLEHLHRELGGRILRVADALEMFARRDPAATEEALIDLLTQAHAEHDIVCFDDLGMVMPNPGAADRPHYMIHLIRSYLSRLAGTSKTLIITTVSGGDYLTDGFGAVSLADYSMADYRQLMEAHAGRSLEGVDFERIFRSHRKLSGNALAFVGRLIARESWPTVSAEAIVGLIDAFLAPSHIDMSEVAPVSLDTLVGIDHIIETLDRTILIPMTQPALARELGLKPKRGVLLHGEPGTGKTTIGRALAQRMQGKFFMIDGTFLPDDQGFQGMFDRILLDAQRSSPSVIFIDDADVIFQNGQSVGFARKLLSKLDGLESESQSQICVVMTAMDVADMPPALVRSGRVEVWVEMKLPDAERRLALLHHFAADLTETLEAIDEARLAEATEGFTPADMRGLVGDAKGHLAYDRKLADHVQTFETYLLTAARDIAQRKSVLRGL